jgi:hypothetical protein
MTGGVTILAEGTDARGERFEVLVARRRWDGRGRLRPKIE